MVTQHMEITNNHVTKMKRNCFLFLVVVAQGILVIKNVQAGEIRFSPSFNIKESYSDNILLAPKGQEQSEYVTGISPAFTLLMSGSHFNANVNYTMQNLFYKNENSRNQTYNQLSATSTTEVIDDYFYFDVNANHSQHIINADQPVGVNNIAVTNNISDVTSYAVAPYLRHSYTGVLDISARYSYSGIDYRRDELIDVTQSGFDVGLNSPVNTPGLSWGMKLLKQESDYETGNDSEFKRGSLQLGYRFSSRTHIYATKGKEENTFSVANNQDISESFWNAGLDWQPGSRDFLTLQYGERFFGHTTLFRWRHTARRLTLNANYEEELSTTALTLLQQQQLASAATQKNQPIDTSNSINSQVFVKKLGTVGVTYTVSKTSLSLSYANDKRIFQDTGDITQAKFANLSVSLTSSPVLTYVFGTTWSSNHTASTDVKLFNTNLNFAIQKQFAARLQGEFSVLHGLRRSTNGATDYDENIISLGITKTFN